MSEVPQVGDKAPDFTTTTDSGEQISLSELRGKKVILYFYPKDDTPGCTTQACGFRDSHADFEAHDAVVFGISPDGEASHAKFRAKYDLPFTLLADVPAPARGAEKPVPPVCEKYGVWQEKSLYGREYMGVVRTTYLIDTEGRVAKRWDKVKVPDHAEEVLEAARELP